jgi:hypothetical protein
MLSDWTNENRWMYTRKFKTRWIMVQDKKGTSTPLNKGLQEEHLDTIGLLETAYGRGWYCGCILSCILINGNSPSNILILKSGEKVKYELLMAGASTSLDDFGVKTSTCFSRWSWRSASYQKQDIYWRSQETYDLMTIPEDKNWV